MTTAQGDLFSYSSYGNITPKDEGAACAEQSAKAAERKGWDREGAQAFILQYLREHGPTSGEVLTTEASKLFPAPDARAYGVVYAMLSKRKLIRQAGWANREKGHNTAGARIWEAVR